jgi:hypothetical protein
MQARSHGGDFPSILFLLSFNRTTMKNKLRPRKLRPRINRPAPKVAKARVSHMPWTGYSRHDAPRENPLPVCPSAACRRAKLCLAAHDNLYCQRTHFSPAEQEERQRLDPLRLELNEVPPVMDPKSLTERAERISTLSAIRRAHDARMTARWKAGEFDGVYGPYKAKGVVLSPPPKIYVEARLVSSPQTRASALG